MKAIEIKEVDGQTEITVEAGLWILKRNTVYRTTGRLAGEFFSWVKLPNKTMVPDGLSFQLDSWKKTGL